MEEGEGQKSSSYLELGSLVEISGADALPDDVPVGAAGGQVHLLLHHDVLQLGANLTHLHGARDQDLKNIVFILLLFALLSQETIFSVFIHNNIKKRHH